MHGMSDKEINILAVTSELNWRENIRVIISRFDFCKQLTSSITRIHCIVSAGKSITISFVQVTGVQKNIFTDHGPFGNPPEPAQAAGKPWR
jgi:hypothetical protein